VASLVLALALLAQSAPAPTLEAGIRLVDEGDFEAAVTTLRAVATALAGDPARSVERARAHLYLGIAHLALDHGTDAHAAFLSALRDDPALRVTEAVFSPKVVAAFEAARTERDAAAPAKGGGSGGRVAAAAIGGAAIAAGAAVALGGGAGERPIRIENLRFATPQIECPNDTFDQPIGYAVLADVVNDGEETPVLGVTLTATITVSELAEVGFTATRPATAAPALLPARRATTLRVDSTLVCSNASGGPPRFNEWKAHLILATAAGTASAETVNSMRVMIP
jgi:hypothetical protein